MNASTRWVIMALACTCACAGERTASRGEGATAPSGTTESNVALADAGLSSVPEGGAAMDAGAPAVLATGTTTVKGGEVFQLDGVRVTVASVVFDNQPCPPGARCVHSGVLKLVRFNVEDAAGAEMRVVSAGQSAVVRGVMLRVLSVEEGPVATVDVQRALVPAK